MRRPALRTEVQPHVSCLPTACSLGASTKLQCLQHTTRGWQSCLHLQVYDLTMMAAINALECGPRKLSIVGEWKWLLAEFASAYGIRSSYAVLTHMRWVMRYMPCPAGYSDSISGFVAGRT